MPLTITRPTATLGHNCIQLRCEYAMKDIAKTVPDWKWNPRTKTWDYPLRPEALRNLQRVFPGLKIDERIPLILQEIADREALAARIKEQGWENAEPIKPMPIKTKAFNHQVGGFNVAYNLMGGGAAALLMEQGCG